jgi:hypothetical protein
VGVRLIIVRVQRPSDALREGAARICGRKARKHGTGTLSELPDEHLWLLGCRTTAGHLESIISRTPPWRAPTTF